MGLDEEYNPLVSAIITRVEPIGYGDLLAQILSFESRLNLSRGENSSQSSANIASRGRGGFSPKNRGGGRGSSGGRGRGNGVRGGRNSNSKPRFNGSAKSASRKGTALLSAGIVLMKTLFLMRRMLTLLPMRMALTRIGTPTRGPPTTSPAI
jgi:hypothetical protein